jgi:uncharacterized membrane protein
MMLAATRAGRPSALLIVSLALNAFLVALVGAHLLRPHLLPASDPAQPGMVGRILAALPADEAMQFQAQLDAARPRYQAAQDTIDASRRALVSALAANPYDEDAVRAALRAYQESWRSFAGKFDDAFLAAIAALPPEGRTRVAAAVAERRPSR